MKRRLSTLLLGMFAMTGSLLSQTLNERKHLVGGNAFWDNFVKEMFQFPSFRPATIFYRDGQQFQRQVNYNRMLETVQFIDEKGDTLAIANESAVKEIVVDSIIFIYQPGCLQVIANHPSAKFLKHEKLRIADIRRKGALGMPNSTSAIESINQVYTSKNAVNLDVDELLLLSKTTTFFFQTSKGDLLPASRKNILQNYPHNTDAIRSFIDAKNTNFTREKDLVKLADFLANL